MSGNESDEPIIVVSRRAMRRFVVALIALVILAAVGVGAFVAGRLTAPHETTTTAIPTTTTHATATTTSTTSPDVVAVVECPSTYGIEGPPPASKYPSTIAVSLPPVTATRLSYYSDSTRSVEPILAPRGWACYVGVGADGQTTVSVFPPGTRNRFPSQFQASAAEGISAHSDSACEGCMYETACPLMSNASEAFPASYISAFKCFETKPPGEEVHWINGSSTVPPTRTGENVVAFTDPPGVAGDGAPSGGPFPAKGVLLFSTDSEQGVAVSIETCTVGHDLSSLCASILQNFISQEWYVSP